MSKSLNLFFLYFEFYVWQIIWLISAEWESLKIKIWGGGNFFFNKKMCLEKIWKILKAKREKKIP